MKWSHQKAIALAQKHGHINDLPCGAISAFAEYIEAHEEAPVDPLLIEAIQLTELKIDLHDFKHKHGERHLNKHWAVQLALLALNRGIEISDAKWRGDAS